MADVKLYDYTIEVQGAIAELAYRAVEEACGELESQVKRNTAVDTGKTKNAWTHHTKQSGNDTTGTVGNPLENSIWEEFGTGEYALNGDGRKGGWWYKNPNVKYTKSGSLDKRYKNNSEFIFTYGKHPRRPFHNAYTSLKNKLVKHIQEVMKGGLS
jgi:hypothetical protein